MWVLEWRRNIETGRGFCGGHRQRNAAFTPLSEANTICMTDGSERWWAELKSFMSLYE